MCIFLFFKWAALVLFIFVIFQAQILQNTEPLTKKFCNFWSGCSSLQLLVVNWKKYPLEFHWQKWPKYVVTLWAIFKTSLFNYQMLWVTFEKSFENIGYFLFQHLVTPHRVLIIIELFYHYYLYETTFYEGPVVLINWHCSNQLLIQNIFPRKYGHHGANTISWTLQNYMFYFEHLQLGTGNLKRCQFIPVTPKPLTKKFSNFWSRI